MEAEAQPNTKKAGKKGKLVVVSTVVLLVAVAATYFFARDKIVEFLDSGVIVSEEEDDRVAQDHDFIFVPIDPVIVSLPGDQRERQLRFTAEIEVLREHEEEVLFLMPRVRDLFNMYLQTVRVSDIDDRTALIRIRIHLMHRLFLVLGPERVRDLLITEFILA